MLFVSMMHDQASIKCSYVFELFTVIHIINYVIFRLSVRYVDSTDHHVLHLSGVEISSYFKLYLYTETFMYC